MAGTLEGTISGWAIHPTFTEPLRVTDEHARLSVASGGRTPVLPVRLEGARDCLCVRSVSATYARWHIARDLGKIGESRGKSHETLNVVEV